MLEETPRYNVAAFVKLIGPYPEEERWELLDGEAVMMAPQSVRHQRIVGNVLALSRDAARRRGFNEYPSLGVLNEARDNYAPIPDVVIRCGRDVPGGYVTDPVLVAEVLSRSTMSNDRHRKLHFYKAIPGLEAILLVHQSRPEVEIWRRHGTGWREDAAFDLDQRVWLLTFDAGWSMAEIYDGVIFDKDGGEG